MWRRPPRPSCDGEAEQRLKGEPRSRLLPSVGEQKTKIKERRKSRKTARKWKCGRASHPTAFVRDFLLCQITAWRRNDRFGPTALPLSRATSAAFAKASCHSQSRDHELASLRWPAIHPALCSEEQQAGGGGGRNARATSRTCARFLECPPVIHPRESPGCRWLCRNHSASSGNFTFR